MDNSEIPGFRVRTFAYNVAFIRVLAECYRLWMTEYDSWKPLARFICKASMNYQSKHGLLVDAGLTNQ